MPTEARQLAEISDYSSLHAALRTRSDELGITRQMLDELGGLQDGYASKLLAPVPLRNIGPRLLGPILGALALRLVLVEDAEALAHIAGLKRKRPSANASDAMLPTKTRKRRGYWQSTEWSRIMNSRRMLVLSARQRRTIARKAARARWRRQKGGAR
jgi:hypothetical protein